MNTATAVQIPLAALRCMARYDQEDKIVFEVDLKQLRRLNKAKTLDEVINRARLDFVVGQYKSFTKVDDLLEELHR